jgi:hypothetical protein
MMFALFRWSSRDDDVACWARNGRVCIWDPFLRFTPNSRASGSKAAIALSILFRSFFNSAKTCSIFKGIPQELAAIPTTRTALCDGTRCSCSTFRTRPIGRQAARAGACLGRRSFLSVNPLTLKGFSANLLCRSAINPVIWCRAGPEAEPGKGGMTSESHQHR